MAKTTADATLVQGAKDMGKASMPVDMKGLDKIIKVGDDMQAEVGKKIKTEVDERKTLTDAFEKDAESIILNSGSLGKTLYNDTFDMVSGYKAQYLKAIQNKDEKGKMAALQGMQAQSLFIKDHKDYRLDMASKIDNKEYSDGMSKSNIHNLKAIQGENYTLGKNDKDETTFNFKDLNGKDVSMTHNEYTKLYEPKNFEITTTTAKLMSEVIKTGQYNQFDVENQITQIIPDDEQGLRAAMGDDILGKKFNVLLAEDKGLDAELIASLSKGGFNSWDVDKDGVIDPEEKTNFIDAVTNFDNPNFDLKASKQIFVNKLSNIVGNHHNQNQVKLKAQKDNEIVEADRQLRLKNTLAKGLASSKSADKINEDTNKAMIEEGKVVTKTNITSGKKTMPNLDPNKSDDGTENTISYDVAYAKDLGDKIEDESFTGGFTGQQMNRYYYKDNKGGFRQYKSKSDFIKENDLNAAIKAAGSIDNLVNGKIVYNEEQEQIIANFKAAVGGLKGGDPISISTLRTDEGIDAAQNEVVEEKTDNIYLQSLRDKKQAEANKNKTTSGGVVRE